MSIHRGIRVGIEPNGETVYVEYNNQVLSLKTGNGREIIDGQYKSALNPETVFALARLAEIDTVDIIDPSNPEATEWGFMTEASPHFNNHAIE